MLSVNTSQLHTTPENVLNRVVSLCQGSEFTKLALERFDQQFTSGRDLLSSADLWLSWLYVARKPLAVMEAHNS